MVVDMANVTDRAKTDLDCMDIIGHNKPVTFAYVVATWAGQEMIHPSTYCTVLVFASARLGLTNRGLAIVRLDDTSICLIGRRGVSRRTLDIISCTSSSSMNKISSVAFHFLDMERDRRLGISE